MSIAYNGSKVASSFSGLGEKNKGKPPLDPQEEYIFELVEAKDQQLKGWQSAEDRAANKPAPKKVHAAITWKEIKSGILGVMCALSEDTEFKIMGCAALFVAVCLFVVVLKEIGIITVVIV